MKCVESTSADTVTCLTELLEQAKRGDLTGVAVAAVYRRSAFDTRVVGAARANPVFTMGLVALMHGELCTALQQLQRVL